MSARRQARSTSLSTNVAASGGVPRSLLIGRCIEVWSGPSDVEYGPALSAHRRWSVVRRWWLETAGVESVADRCALIPMGGLWSVEYLTHDGQDERMGRPVRQIVAEQLGRAGVTVDDIDDLRAEAIDLFKQADSRTKEDD